MSAAPTPDDKQQRLFGPHVLFNNNSIYNVKFISSCFTGAVAGILGLENWLGFIFFIFTTLFTALILHLFNLKTNPRKFFQGGLLEAVNPGQENAFSFILVWTLFYGWSFNSPGCGFGKLKEVVARHRSWCVHPFVCVPRSPFRSSIRLIYHLRPILSSCDC